MRIALVSLNQTWENKNENFSNCRLFVHNAKVHGAELVIFPEMTLTGFSMNISDIAEDRTTSSSVELFQQLAREFRIAILFGVVFQDGSKATNNAILVNDEGVIKGGYSKIHPFSFAGEDKVFNGGDQICLVNLGKITIGLTICYDLRFPELYSALGKRCELIVNIANWPKKRVEHWNTLLKARAIENQIFVIGVNRTGTDGQGLDYLKSTQALNPNGDLIAATYSDDQIDIANIDSDFIAEYRKSFSTTQDRKPALYKSFL